MIKGIRAKWRSEKVHKRWGQGVSNNFMKRAFDPDRYDIGDHLFYLMLIIGLWGNGYH